MDDAAALPSLGVEMNGYKVLIFEVGSMFEGTAAHYSIRCLARFLAPESFNPLLSVSFLTVIVVGDLGTIWGY